MSPGARLLVPYVRREWRSLATVGVTTGVAAAAELARPLPLALVVNALIAEAGGPAGFELDGRDLWLLAGVAGLVRAHRARRRASRRMSRTSGSSARESGSRTTSASRRTQSSSASRSVTTRGVLQAISSRA